MSKKGPGRPALHPEGTTTKITLTIPTMILERVDAFAEHLGHSRSELVTTCCRIWLRNRAKLKR